MNKTYKYKSILAAIFTALLSQSSFATPGLLPNVDENRSKQDDQSRTSSRAVSPRAEGTGALSDVENGKLNTQFIIKTPGLPTIASLGQGAAAIASLGQGVRTIGHKSQLSNPELVKLSSNSGFINHEPDGGTDLEDNTTIGTEQKQV